MKEIIESLYEDNHKFNYDAVNKARENKGVINEYLLDELEKIVNGINEDNVDVPIFVDYALFLLAEFREKKACPLLVKLLSFTFLDYYNSVGSGIMDSIPALLASVYDGNINAINKIIENKEIDDFSRDRVLVFYQYLYENDMISKDEVISYLRKIIKLYNYEGDYIYNTILGLIINLHLIEMVEDVKVLFDEYVIDPHIRGGYMEFIDDLFNYDRVDEIDKIESVEKSMEWWAYFHEDDSDGDFDEDKMSDMFKDFIKKDREENIIDYSKVGRNDPCPCGSGKKYKKCCLDKTENVLPYQKYIDKSLEDYPKKNNNKGELDFYSIYKEEYINIDKLLYKAIKSKRVPLFVDRRRDKEDDNDYAYLNEAYPLIKDVIEKNGFKTIDEYDKEVSIHISLYNFFTKYFECMLSKYKRGKKDILKDMEELIKYFYDTFDIDPEYENVFLDKIDDYYCYSEKYEEGIVFFESKLSNKHTKYDVYNYLFNLYSLFYDFDECIKKMDDCISNEKDEDLKEFLYDEKFKYMEN